MERWMNLGVSGQVEWPRRRHRTDFGGHKLVLMPRTKTAMASIHIEISRLDNVEAMTIVNRFLSLLSWCNGQPVINHYGWSGSPAPVPVPAERDSFCVADYFAFARLPLTEPKQQLAVALYREARSVNSVPYAFLGYFKILNILWDDRKRNGRNPLVEGIRRLLPKLTDHKCIERIAILKKQPDPATYLYESGRCAVAHAHKKARVDPDDVTDLHRLSEDLNVVRALAEHLIEKEMGVSRCPWADAP